jgi:tetratricopeptide (TPR) repeat protein
MSRSISVSQTRHSDPDSPWIEAATTTARMSLLAAVIVLPWSFGSVDPISQSVMFIVLLVAQAAFVAALTLGSPLRSVIPPPAVPLAALMLLGLLQSTPLPLSLMTTVSPRSVALNTELLDDGDAGSAAQEDERNFLSVYPPATRKETGLLFAALVVLLIAGHVFTTPGALGHLAVVLAINGAALAYFGLMQRLSWNGRLYWTVETEGHAVFGPFINRNGGGSYLVLCLAGLIPLVAGWVAQRSTTRWASAAWTPAERRWFRPSAEIVGIGLVVVGVLILAGLLAAMSRGAWIGAACALAAIVGLFGRSLPRGSVVGLLAVLLLATGLLSWLDLHSELGGRLSSLNSTEAIRNSRWLLWRDSLRILPDYWPTGTGWGTFGFVFPLYQTQPMKVWYDQAENLYLQSLIEGGVLGGLLSVALVNAAVWPLRSLWRTDLSLETKSLAAFAIFAVVGQAVCAFFDFSLRYPAHHWTLALVVGGVIGYAARCRTGEPTKASSSLLIRAATIGLHLVMFVGLCMAWREESLAGGADLALVRGERGLDEQGLSDEAIEESLHSLLILLRHRPDDAEVQLRVASLHVVRYRQTAFQQLRDELGDETTDDELWTLTSLMVLHARAAEFARTDDANYLVELRNEPIVRDHLQAAREAAWKARQLGPVFPEPHRLLAMLQFLAGDPLADAIHIDHVVRLQPRNPEVRYWAGRMHRDAGRTAAALAEWKACLALSPDYDDEIFAAGAMLSSDELLQALAPDEWPPLLRMAERSETLPLDDVGRRQLSDKLQAALARAATTSMPAGALNYAAAQAALLHGDQELARDQLRQAISQAPKRVDWRLLLAGVYRDLGELTNALNEAEVCLRLTPDDPATFALWQSLTDAVREQSRRER